MVKSILMMLLNRLKIWLLHLLGIIKRGLCCFRRRRRNSYDDVQLTDIGVVSSSPQMEIETWDQWGEGVPDSVVAQQQRGAPNIIQERIEMYRQQTMAIASRKIEDDSEETQNEADYFQDMTPRLTKQKKIMLKTKQNSEENFSPALSLGMQIAPVQMDGELGEWEENPGWDDEVQLDPNDTVDMIVREKRRLERERRIAEQQEKRAQRQARSVTLGARIS